MSVAVALSVWLYMTRAVTLVEILTPVSNRKPLSGVEAASDASVSFSTAVWLATVSLVTPLDVAVASVIVTVLPSTCWVVTIFDDTQ